MKLIKSLCVIKKYPPLMIIKINKIKINKIINKIINKNNILKICPIWIRKNF